MGTSRWTRLLRAVAAIVLFSLPVLLLGFAVREQFDPLIRLDKAVIIWATDLTRSTGAAPALVALQEATQPKWVHVVGTLVALWAWLAKGLRNRALWAFATLMVGWSVGYFSKLVVQRARPVVTEPVSHSPGFSFPSGHALNIAVFASVMVFLLWPLVTSAPARRVLVAAAAVLVLAVGCDRVFLGAHFPSDVTAGFILGLGITFSSWIGFIGKTAATSSPGPSARA